MNIYFSGSMTSGQDKLQDYQEMIKTLEKYGVLLNKYVGEIIKDIKPSDSYKRDTTNLKKADALIADITIASTGVGFELGYADNLQIPTLILYDEAQKLPSASVRGNPHFSVHGYKTITEAQEIIKDFLEKIAK